MEVNSMAEEQQKLVYRLSDMDQSVPRDYARRMFIFDFPDRTRRAEATSALRRGLKTAFKAYPHLTGRVGPDEGPDENQVKERDPITVRYGETAAAREITEDVFQASYHKKAAEFYSYGELCHMNMPVSHWKSKDFCIAPISWTDEDWVPAVTLKVTFLGSGGLVLCFAFHNAVADDRSISMFIETFANGTRNPSAINGIRPYVQPMDLAESCDFDYEAMHYLWDDGRFPELDFDDSKPVFPYPQSSHSRLIKFPAKAIAALKDDCLAYIMGYLNLDSLYLSTTDVLSALVWVSLLRARHARFNADDYDQTAPFATTIDWRLRDSDGVVPPDYFGNASTNAAVVTLKLRDIVHPETTRCPGSGAARLAPTQLGTIAICADQIRQTLLQVQPDSIEDRLAIYTTFERPLEASVASRRALQSHKQGVRVGSLADSGGADFDFGIPGTNGNDGRPRFVRKPWMTENGLVNILPRRRDSDDDWVVLVGADGPVLDQLCWRRELGRWASGWVDDWDPSLWCERRFGACRIPDEEHDDEDGDVEMK
ncbi:transferase [Apiospora marii]|uniref:transferase n=1 Tax=Apiospora marii TaxID=335849 RepID=UPI00312FFFA6